MNCACTAMGICDTTRSEMISITTPKARKSHICNECHRMIVKGEEYRREFYKHDNETYVHKTCDHCLSVREVFFSNGYYYGEIWNFMENFINDTDGDLSVACLLSLTKPAKDRVLDMIEKQWENSNEAEKS